MSSTDTKKFRVKWFAKTKTYSKTIRLRNLVKSCYNIKDIKDIFRVNVDSSNDVIAEASVFTELLNDFSLYQPSQDVQVTYYVAGYLTRGIVKQSKCTSCNGIVSDGCSH